MGSLSPGCVSVCVDGGGGGHQREGGGPAELGEGGLRLGSSL